ncbi:MAG TPA: DUF262 domain-containing protein [Pyrinomonadaceae bacterium]|nr:DUF262 domain-containing protein [Pyrinomonadaceae bacterium]
MAKQKTNNRTDESKRPDEELEVDEVMDDEEEVAVTYDIASYPSDLTVSVIYEMWNNGDIEIPEFQRNFVWNIRQSSLLIDSFLLGLPVPQVFFYVDERNKSVVIDGQQRILTIVFFLEGYFGSENIQGRRQVFRLQGLDEKKNPLAKKRFVDLDESAQRKLKGAVLRAINIKQLQPMGETTSIYHIFERLNTGGTPLRPQEIRNCVFRGDFVRVLRELNTDSNWRKILGKVTFDKHQKDVELILRVFAFTGAVASYEKPMKEFLNKTMRAEQNGTSAKVQKFQRDFPKAARVIVEKLGEKPFHVRGPLNTSVLDAVFCTILESLDHIPRDLSQRFKTLLQDKTFEQATYYSTSDVTVVEARFNEAKKILIGS